MAIALRVAGTMAVLAVVTLFVLAPWRDEEGASFIGTESEGLASSGLVGASRGMGDATGDHMVTYEMPKPEAAPALPDNVSALTWEDLWEEGEYVAPQEGAARVGTPEVTEFPEGSTAEDVAMFFLDIADMRSMQPLVGTVKSDLDGQRVRLAGYTTPVGFAEEETDFLLVPELGACIHVPPPPPNQIVYVPDAPQAEMFAPVWVTGTLRAEPVATILADAAYRLEDVSVEPYR